MTWALVAVVLIAVGLPLGAFWVGGRRFWSRLRIRQLPADRQGALYREVVLRHRLRPAEIAQVEGAVTWGRRLEDPRLRAALVDWAERLLADAAGRRAAHPRRRRLLLFLLVVWAVALATAVVLSGATHDWGALLRGVLYGAVFGVPGWLAARGPRRALRLNRDEPPAAGGPAPAAS